MRALSRCGVALGGLAVVIGTSAPAGAWKQVVTDTGVALHWTETTIGYTLDEALPDGWDPQATSDIVDAAFAPWAEINCYSLTFENLGYAAGATEADDGVNWIRWANDWQYSSLLLALTSIHVNTKTGRILDVDIEVNVDQKPFDVSWECSDDKTAYDLWATLTHEIGHLVGLDHSKELDSTMHGSSGKGECTKRTLTPDDLDGFCATYTNLPVPPDPGPDAGGVADAGAGDLASDTVTRVEGKTDDGCSGADRTRSFVVVLAGLFIFALTWAVDKRMLS